MIFQKTWTKQSKRPSKLTINFRKEELRNKVVTLLEYLIDGLKDSKQYTLVTTMGQDLWKQMWLNTRTKENQQKKQDHRQSIPNQIKNTLTIEKRDISKENIKAY